MGFLGKLFKKETSANTPRGFFNVKVKAINRLTKDAVEVVFDIPQNTRESFNFLPGQYITISTTFNGKEERRSYSICSAPGTDLAIGVKEVKGGKVSAWINNSLNVGDSVLISKPEGRFLLGNAKNVVAIAAGSGITPILSMASALDKSGGKMKLLFANKTEKDILFKATLDKLSAVEKRYYLTQEQTVEYKQGRITKETFIDFIKEDLAILKADGFFICGPEEMIMGVKAALEMFGVPADKIHFELFNPTAVKEEVKAASSNFSGVTKMKVILDDEVQTIEIKGNKTILDAAVGADIDAPYSCRGGVCSTCRAKVVSGTVKMNLNYTLTDKEVEDGYILTCQSHATSEELTISYDE